VFVNLSPDWLIASFFVSTIGFGLFLYGKKQTRIPQLLTGLALMIYPSFVASPLWMSLIAAGLLGGLWFGTRAGL